MKICHLSLQDFRSYKNLELPLNEGTHIFIGENGEGKTNIVEAIMYLALLSSHRISTDAPLIKLGAERGYIRAKVSDQDRDTLIELEINNGKANRAKVNQNPVRSQRAISGIVKAICFSPEDLDLVRGDPSERRSFLDHLLIQRNPRLGGVISDYEKALKQRNTLLKARAPESTLAPWNEHLANFGGEIIAARLKLIRELIPHLMNSYENISVKKQPSLEYKSNLDNLAEDKEDNKSEILRKIEEVGFQERERGASLVGPHRDDLLLNLGEHPVKGFASHGESWSIALSLRLASYQLLKADGDNPILILDDVFSELDEKRRERLVALTNTAEQTLITVAVANDLPSELTGSRYQVANGVVTPL
jgi:DNA replication and repair protein RecF